MILDKELSLFIPPKNTLGFNRDDSFHLGKSRRIGLLNMKSFSSAGSNIHRFAMETFVLWLCIISRSIYECSTPQLSLSSPVMSNEGIQQGTTFHFCLFTFHFSFFYIRLMVQKQNQNVSTSTGSKLIRLGPVKIRLSRFLFVTVMILTTFALIWPGFSLFSSATPLVFGFPLSFAWIILWVIIGFFAMLGLYLSDSKIEETD